MNICKYCGSEPYFIETPDGNFCATCNCAVFAAEGKTKEEAAKRYVRKRNRVAIVCNLIVYTITALIIAGLVCWLFASALFIVSFFKSEEPETAPTPAEIQAAEDKLFTDSTKLYPVTPQFPEGTQTNEP